MLRAWPFGMLALACDDPNVATKATEILTHGIAEAHVTCVGQSINDPVYGWYNYDLLATKFVDGSALVSVSSGIGSVTAFTARVAAEPSARFYVNSSPRTVTFAGGFAKFDAPGAENYDSIALGLHCSGFHLEAFGVIP